MAIPKSSTGTLPPELIRFLEADDNHKVRSHTCYLFNRSTLRHMSLLKGWCLFVFLLITAAYFSLGSFSSHKRTDYADPAWAARVQNSALRQGGGMVVLVTGAAGFVGSHVSLALKERGDGVVGLDNFNSYYPVALKRARAKNLLKAGVFVVEGDINDRALLERLFGLVTFSHVLHLAAQAGVRYATHNPMAYVESHVNGFVVLLEQCKSTNPQPAIVFASSSSVYGLNDKVPFSEDDTTDPPARSLYAATKKADEGLAHTYNHIYGLSITALRFFTVYGPWGRPDMAYFSFTTCNKRHRRQLGIVCCQSCPRETRESCLKRCPSEISRRGIQCWRSTSAAAMFPRARGFSIECPSTISLLRTRYCRFSRTTGISTMRCASSGRCRCEIWSLAPWLCRLWSTGSDSWRRDRSSRQCHTTTLRRARQWLLLAPRRGN